MGRLLLTLLCGWGLLPTIALGQRDKTAYYKAESYDYAGITLPYRELDMNQELEGASLLVIQLHGGTARGNDNKAQLDASAVDSVEIYLRVHKAKAIFLLPQCDKSRVWNESSRSQETPMTEVLAHWLEYFIQTHDIDVNRIYITGYSAGGSGTWRMLNDNTETFAAACIAAATPLMVEAKNVAKTPVYAIAGTDDTIMDAEKIEAFTTSLTSMGGEARFDLLEGKDHFGTCDDALTRERLAWMFSHRRNTPSAITPICPTEELPQHIYGIDGRTRTRHDRGMLIIRHQNGSTQKVMR